LHLADKLPTTAGDSKHNEQKENTNMKKLALLGLGIAGACVAGLHGDAGAAACQIAPVPAAQLAECTETTAFYTGSATVTNSSRRINVSLSGGDGRPARATSIGFKADGRVAGSAVALIPGSGSGSKDVTVNVVTHDVQAVANLHR
jgi:hypothetical protein